MYLEGRFEDGEWDGGVDSKQKSGDRSAPAVLRPLVPKKEGCAPKVM